MSDKSAEPHGRSSVAKIFSSTFATAEDHGSSRPMALAAGKVEDVEEAEAALLEAHVRKHGGQAAKDYYFRFV